MGHVFDHEQSFNEQKLLNTDLYTVMNTRMCVCVEGGEH